MEINNLILGEIQFCGLTSISSHTPKSTYPFKYLVTNAHINALGCRANVLRPKAHRTTV